MRSTMQWLAVLGLGVLAGCGGGDPPNPNATGTWTYSSSMVGSGNAAGVTCNISNLTLTINESGTTFSGTYSGGVIACQGPGGSSSTATGSGSVASGSLVHNAVNFDFDNSSWHHTGGLTDNQMSGSFSAQLSDASGTPLPFTGSWTASRR